MNETQLRNLSDEELLRVVDNMVPTNILAVELARRLRDAMEAADIAQGELDAYNDRAYGYCEDDNCPYCCGGDD